MSALIMKGSATSGWNRADIFRDQEQDAELDRLGSAATIRPDNEW